MTLADDFGDDPARFLARRTTGTAVARIRGLETIEEVEQWIRCEKALGTRRPILKALAERREALEAIPRAESETEEVAADA